MTTLYVKDYNGSVVWLLVYVDDILVTGNNKAMIEHTKRDLQQQFKIKDLGDMQYFLGIEMARSQEGIVLNQRKYVLELIAEAGLTTAKSAINDTNGTKM